MENLTELLEIIEKPNQSIEEKVKLLKLHRCRLLDEIHRKQQLLDQIDYMIIKIKKEK